MKKNYAKFLLMLFLITFTLISCSSNENNIETHTSKGNIMIEKNNASDIEELNVLEGHTGAIYSLAWSPDGKYIASGSQDKTVRIWDTQTFESFTLEGHTNSVWGVDWSSDSKKIVSIALDKTVRIWDIVNRKEIKKINLSNTNNYSVDWSPDDKYIAIGLGNGWINIIDVESEEIVNKWDAHTSGGISTEIITIKWQPNGKMIASGGLDYSVRIWEDISGKPVAQLKADTDKRNDINGLNWSNDGNYIASAGQDGYVRIWDVTSLSEKQNVEHSSWWVRGIFWSPDDSIIASCGMNTVICLWDTENNKLLAELEAHSSAIWSLTWSPDGKYIASGSGDYEKTGGDSTIRIWGIN